MTVRIEQWGSLDDGSSVELYRITNRNGLVACVTSYGATLVSWETPDREGRPGDVVLGHSSLEGYLRRNQPYFGCIVGRFANRIANARFTLDGVEHRLFANEGRHSIHGGRRGFDKRSWRAEPLEDGVRLSLASPDGDEGYPGRLDVRVTYRLTGGDELAISYEATCDRATVLNLTHHSYFNLEGEGRGTILDHEATIEADRFVVVDETLIPTGELREVAGSPMDFRAPKRIGRDLDAVGGDPAGYDHTFVLRGPAGVLKPVATVRAPGSGRVMEVESTEPGVQFYTGNFLDGSIPGKSGRAYARHEGFCLETQHFPDSPNRPEFPPAFLRPGEVFRSETIHRFRIES